MNIKKKIENYWNKQPCNIKYSKNKFGTKQFFNDISKKKFFVEKHIKNFAEFSKFKNKNVLEIGCGIGTTAFEFVKNKANYVGLDISKKSLEIAELRFKVFNIKGDYKFIYGDSEKISKIKLLSKKKFDLIYSFGVLHHSPNLKKSFNEIYKIAKKNTLIKIMLYNKFSYKSFMINLTKYRYEAQNNCPVVLLVNEDDIKKIVKNKFKIISITKDFIFPYKIKPYKKNRYELIEHFESMPKNIFNSIKKNIGEHLLITLKKINYK